MQASANPRVKICCISSVEEARMAITAGADALGLVSAMPSGPGVVDEDLIATIARLVPPPLATFLLTSALSAAAIVAQQRRCGTSTIQIVDRLPPGSHAQIRVALPGIRIVQVIHVNDATALDEALEAAATADALLLDSGNPKLVTKELGGTGRVHDWTVSARIRAAVDVPIFLAGGLRPDNVREAIDRVGPFGVDLCSGVRSYDRLDANKLGAFMAACRAQV